MEFQVKEDCNDSNAYVNPRAIEITNDIDDYCYGQIDEEIDDETTHTTPLDITAV